MCRNYDVLNYSNTNTTENFISSSSQQQHQQQFAIDNQRNLIDSSDVSAYFNQGNYSFLL